MRIGELARRTGATPRALRYYEEQGLLAPERRPSGYREYGEPDVDTVRGIRTLLAAGLNSAVIAEILHGLPGPGQRPPGPTCPELLDGLARERARITRQMDELAEARSLLDAIMGAEAPSEAIRSGRLRAADRRSAGEREQTGGRRSRQDGEREQTGGRRPRQDGERRPEPTGGRRPQPVARKLDGARSRTVLE
ncbi:MerR family transcriptional regulator [Kitasatospora sp. NPDC056789]|uniref:MerR family transcriptional regulator n=1 Tax=Streptomycetaceae TaxID=2062 RepID=UPI00093CA9CA